MLSRSNVVVLKYDSKVFVQEHIVLLFAFLTKQLQIIPLHIANTKRKCNQILINVWNTNTGPDNMQLYK